MLLQSWLTLCDSMDCSLPVSSVCGILQAKILEWVAMPCSRGSSWPRDWTFISYVSCIGRRVLYHYCHVEALHELFHVIFIIACPIREECSLFPFYIWGNRGTESLNQLLRSQTLISGIIWLWIQAVISQLMMFLTSSSHETKLWFIWAYQKMEPEVLEERKYLLSHISFFHLFSWGLGS